MKVLIDLIEDIREEIANHPEFTLHAMLLREDSVDSTKLVNAGESLINSFRLDDMKRQVILKIEGSADLLSVEEVIKHLLILDMQKMMYEVILHVNHEHAEVEVLGFGKSLEEKKYFFFIKL